MQPSSPMAIPDNEASDDMPEHLPVHMALAPEQRPYEHTRTIRREDLAPGEEGRHKLTSHSLSPEHLGVVGYVKDVACFVKDAVKEARDKRAGHQRSQQVERRRSSGEVEETATRQPAAHSPSQPSPSPRRESSPSALAETVTGLFPGLDPNAPACSHADELRHELMHSNSREGDHSPGSRFMLGEK